MSAVCACVAGRQAMEFHLLQKLHLVALSLLIVRFVMGEGESVKWRLTRGKI